MRTNIEEQDWARFHKVANGLGIRWQLVAGMTASLWHESQLAMRCEGCISEIRYWAGMSRDDDFMEWIDLWVQAGVLIWKDLDAEELYIVGNEKHIASYRQKCVASARAQELRNMRQNEINAMAPRSDDRPVTVRSPSDDRGDDRSGHPTQLNSTQLKEERENGVPPICPLFELWEKERGPFSAVKAVSDARKKKAASQFKRHPDLAYWRSIMSRWKSSQFCLTKWKPNFDDLLNETKRISTLEGKYDNRQEQTTSFGKPQPRSIVYPSSDQIFAEQEEHRSREPPADPVKVRELIAKALGGAKNN